MELTETFGVFLNHPDAKMPTKANYTDAGWDTISVEDTDIAPNERKIIPTGIHLKLKPGWECQIRARSGNAAKLGLMVVNGVGTIDSEYVGEVKVILYNSSKETVKLPKGSKIAQLVFKKVPWIDLKQLTEMPSNDSRGNNGFGSSGLKG
jgi:dUTP pyrophosphatase